MTLRVLAMDGAKTKRGETTPAAAAVSGQAAGQGSLEDRVRSANEKNDERLLKGDWRAAKPAVGPQQ